MALKLYVWHDVLRDWKCGIAFALAHSTEEAAELLKKKLDWSTVPWDGVKLDGVPPIEYSEPFAHYLWGGQ